MALIRTDSYLKDSLDIFVITKRLANGDESVQRRGAFRNARQGIQFHRIVVKHIAGNMRSRWADFPDNRR